MQRSTFLTTTTTTLSLLATRALSAPTPNHHLNNLNCTDLTAPWPSQNSTSGSVPFQNSTSSSIIQLQNATSSSIWPSTWSTTHSTTTSSTPTPPPQFISLLIQNTANGLSDLVSVPLGLDFLTAPNVALPDLTSFTSSRTLEAGEVDDSPLENVTMTLSTLEENVQCNVAPAPFEGSFDAVVGGAGEGAERTRWLGGVKGDLGRKSVRCFVVGEGEGEVLSTLATVGVSTAWESGWESAATATGASASASASWESAWEIATATPAVVTSAGVESWGAEATTKAWY